MWKYLISPVFSLQCQLQIVLLDPAQFSQDEAEGPGENGWENEADQEKTDPIHGGDAWFCAAGHILDPAGVNTDLPHKAAGAHAGGDGGAIHFQLKQAGGQGTGDGRG